jgi:signal peptidase I
MTNLIVFFLIIQVIHFLGTWKLYKKAGRATWEAAVPIYNAYVLTKIINRPWWWVILLFIPIINLLMFPAFWVETVRSYGKEKTSDLFLVVFSLGFYIYYLNYLSDVNYQSDRQLKPHTRAGEWTTSIVFAVVAATLVHTYFMRPYTIPTSSLEKSLLVGDYLFVSKFHYGARTPKTAFSLPMVHDTMPIPYTGIRFKSYIKDVQLPNFRFPGFQKIKRNDIVVFNWPADTVRFFRDQSGIHADKPLDKKSNYVKRCVGIPGDSLEIRDGYIFINGKQTVLPDRAKPQFFYTVDTGGKNINLQRFIEKYNITEGGRTKDGRLMLNLTKEAANYLKKQKSIKSVIQSIDTAGVFEKRIFPHNPQYAWSKDNYGPIYIPKKGDVVKLNKKSMPFYKRIIKEYEGNDLTIDGDTYYINAEIADSYTFKQDYYWMMGDNRHNSEDARYWGYVPFDHVVGKPVFIWFSIEQYDSSNPKSFFKRIRTKRLFTTVHFSGKPKSYLIHFLVVIALLWGFSFIRNRKKTTS